MDRNQILKALKDEKVQNYTYTIAFFMIFALFVVFAIRPNLTTAFNLQKELQDIKLKNQEYEQQIQEIVEYQTKVEQFRDQFFLLSEAVPNQPAVAKVVDDIRKSASESGMLLTQLAVETVDIKPEKPDNKLKSFSVTMATATDLPQLQLFFDTLLDQRRIKFIKEIQLTASNDNDEVSGYTVTMVVIGYYL